MEVLLGRALRHAIAHQARHPFGPGPAAEVDGPGGCREAQGVPALQLLKHGVQLLHTGGEGSVVLLHVLALDKPVVRLPGVIVLVVSAVEAGGGLVFRRLGEVRRAHEALLGLDRRDRAAVDGVQIGRAAAESAEVEAGGHGLRALTAKLRGRAGDKLGAVAESEEVFPLMEEDQTVKAGLILPQGQVQAVAVLADLPFVVVGRLADIHAVGGQHARAAALQRIDQAAALQGQLALTLEAAVLKDVVALPEVVLPAEKIAEAGDLLKLLLGHGVGDLAVQAQAVLLGNAVERVQHLLVVAVVDLTGRVLLLRRPGVHRLPVPVGLAIALLGLGPGQRGLRLGGIGLAVGGDKAAGGRSHIRRATAEIGDFGLDHACGQAEPAAGIGCHTQRQDQRRGEGQGQNAFGFHVCLPFRGGGCRLGSIAKGLCDIAVVDLADDRKKLFPFHVSKPSSVKY